MTSHGTESTLRLVQSKPQAHPPFVLELATAKHGGPWIRSLKQDMPVQFRILQARTRTSARKD